MTLRDFVPDYDEDHPDLFEPQDTRGGNSFPCCACKHQHRPESECETCAHYYH